jgi:hypothetical protein
VAQLSPRDLLKALARMGFQGREGRRHTVCVLVLDGKKTRVRTVVDRHGRDFGENRIKDYAGQLGLERDEFDRFVGGDMDRTEYERLVTERGKI